MVAGFKGRRELGEGGSGGGGRAYFPGVARRSDESALSHSAANKTAGQTTVTCLAIRAQNPGLARVKRMSFHCIEQANFEM